MKLRRLEYLAESAPQTLSLNIYQQLLSQELRLCCKLICVLLLRTSVQCQLPARAGPHLHPPTNNSELKRRLKTEFTIESFSDCDSLLHCVSVKVFYTHN